jgi:NADH-quinone oxidoreductase subunit E
MTTTTTDVQEQVKAIAEKWQGRDGNLIMILHEIQGHFGYIPRSVALDLSRTLDIPLASIYEVITFYNYFKLEKPGKYNIAVCMGTACYLKGAPDLLAAIKDVLDITEGETTPDGLFRLDAVRCLGCCGLAPVIMINEKIYSKVKKSQIPEILSKYKNED